MNLILKTLNKEKNSLLRELTIGLCVKNAERTIKQSIEAILAQDFPKEQIKLVIVDGCSEDNTVPILERVTKDAHISPLILTDNGKGLGTARQIAVNHLEGKYLLFIDGDVYIAKDFIKRQFDFMEKNATVGVAFGRPIDDGATITSAIRNLHHYSQGGLLGNDATIFRSIALLQAKGYDTQIVGAAEDRDLITRIKNLGWKVENNSLAMFYHDSRSTLKSFFKEQVWFGFGDHYYYHKHSRRNLFLEKCIGDFKYSIRSAFAAFKITGKKKSFLIPLQLVFGRVAWWVGYYNAHCKAYGHAQKEGTASLPRNALKTIIWARDILLDVHLHKTTEIGILQELAKRGNKIHFVSAFSRQRHPLKSPNITNYQIHIKNTPLLSRLIFTLTQTLLYPLLLVKTKPDYIVVDEDSLYGLIPSLPLFNLAKVKIVFDVRSTPTSILSTKQKTGLYGYFLSSSFNVAVLTAKRFLDGMTVLTEMMKEEVCSRFEINPDWVGVWTSGVSAQLYNPRDHMESTSQIRKEFALSSNFVVSYHGGFTQSRGLMDVIEAVSLLKDRHPSVCLLLLGSGSNETLLEMNETIQRLNLKNHVIMHGPVAYTEVPKFIAMSDVGIIPLPDLPQWRCQCPLKLLEYLAMEKPVIVTDIPCHRAVIGTSECGIFVPSTQPYEIAKGIEYAFENRMNLKYWGKQGLEIITGKYTWKIIARDLEGYLENTTRPKKRT